MNKSEDQKQEVKRPKGLRKKKEPSLCCYIDRYVTQQGKQRLLVNLGAYRSPPSIYIIIL